MLAENGIESSMSELGCPYDDSCVESFFATFKKMTPKCKTSLAFLGKICYNIRTDLYRYIELFYKGTSKNAQSIATNSKI